MGFDKKYVSDIKTLKQQYDELKLNEFVHLYINAESLIGDTESMDYLNDKIEKYQKDNNKTKTNH